MNKEEWWNALKELDITKISSLIEQGIDVNGVEEPILEWTALHNLCYRSDRGTDKVIEIIECLLKNGANPNLEEFSAACTPLDLTLVDFTGNGDEKLEEGYHKLYGLLTSYGAKFNKMEHIYKWALEIEDE